VIQRVIIAALMFGVCCRTSDETVVAKEQQQSVERTQIIEVDSSPRHITTLPKVSPQEAGWSLPGLEAARAYSERIGSGAVVIVDRGRVVDLWGDTSRTFNVRSMRKALLGSLIGRAVGEGKIRLDATLAELAVDDIAGLTDDERRATVRDLLMSSSGIYHPAAYAAPGEDLPARGSQPHGTFYYNNWDFNALGSIYEKATGRRIFSAFNDEIAKPLGMEHYDLGKQTYRKEGMSIHPAYLFEMSAVDMARFGVLYAHGGRTNGQQVVPENWVKDSVTPHVKTPREGQSFGYLWWVTADGFLTTGNGGQILYVDPKRDIVIVHLVNTNVLWLKRAMHMNVTNSERAKLLEMILNAAPDR
jgi:CubicO group peptidase (beta-lactamase class C family)